MIDSLVLHASDDLKVLLDPVTVAEMRDYGTANVDAYRDAREGNTFLASGTYESRRQAEALYRSATTKDPRFGYAYQMDAGMYASLAGSASSVQMTAADHTTPRGCSRIQVAPHDTFAPRATLPSRYSTCAAPQERRQQDRGARRGGYGEKG